MELKPWFCQAYALHSPWTTPDQTSHQGMVVRERQQPEKKPAMTETWRQIFYIHVLYYYNRYMCIDSIGVMKNFEECVKNRWKRKQC